MSIRRKIQAPGIEIREIDRSSYEQTSDNSIVGTTSLINGFADNGEDFTVKYINSINTFYNTYGTPKTEAERYFYNGAYEILNRGGRLYCAKLPYDNNSYKKYTYTKYTVDTNNLNLLSSPYEITIGNSVSSVSMYEFMIKPEETYCEWYTNNNIHLSILTDLFDFINKKVNFSYSTKNAIEAIFKKDGIVKNDLIYTLEYLYTNHQQIISKYPQYEKEINDIHNSLTSYGTIVDIEEGFGKSRTLSYFNVYITNLRSNVSKITDTTGKEILNLIDKFIEDENLSMKYTEIRQNDESIWSYITISSNIQDSDNCGMIDLLDVDKFSTGETRPKENDIMFISITRDKYIKDGAYNTQQSKINREYIGNFVAITTPINAMMVQQYIDIDDEQYRNYAAISSIQNIWSISSDNMMSGIDNSSDSIKNNKIAGFTQNIGCEDTVSNRDETLSKTAASLFPQFKYKNGITESKYLKQIGVVVFKMWVDTSNDGKISFTPVESYVGSLNKNEIDEDTGSSTFIDKIINNQSQYIRCYSNVKFRTNNSDTLLNTDKTSMFLITKQNVTSLGFYESDCEKNISLENSINNALNTMFDSMNDPNRYRIDMVVDAGVSNIAQFISSVYKDNKKGKYDLTGENSSLFNIESSNSATTWFSIIKKYDDFCKNIRKDCMFVADGMRPLCLIGDEKRVRNTSPDNTIENTVLKDIKKISGYINSSFSAGYCNWFKCIDQFSGDYFWCPPSIKAAGIYTYTDAYSSFWMAPAGLNRGKLPSDVIDCAFSPTIDQAGTIYNNNWNYAINYPIDGIVLEGQRTFQKNKTALDRVNVRRLCLGIEKVVKHVAKFFNYEQNTEWLRSRFKDSISNYLDEVKTGDGISDYVVIVDDRNNTPQTIDNNELHCTIAIKPIKAVEFIICQFVCTNQSANVQEIAESEL